jgi:hypothetical protein
VYGATKSAITTKVLERQMGRVLMMVAEAVPGDDGGGGSVVEAALHDELPQYVSAIHA